MLSHVTIHKSFSLSFSVQKEEEEYFDEKANTRTKQISQEQQYQQTKKENISMKS